jgi:hypothetical protein
VQYNRLTAAYRLLSCWHDISVARGAAPSQRWAECPAHRPWPCRVLCALCCRTTQRMADKYGDYSSDFKQKGWFAKKFGK